MKVTRYAYLLTLNDRNRHEHVTDQGNVTQFMVQYKTYVEGEWLPVVR